MKVFIGCSSRENIPDKYFNDCEKLLDELFKLNNDLVFGAYNKGLMALSYDKAIKYNRKVIGITPKIFVEDLKELDCTKEIITDTISRRTDELINESDVLLFLPGGIGTIYELFTAIESKKSGEFNKPIIIYNSNNFFDKLLEFIDVLYNENFSDISVKECYYIVSNVEEVIEHLTSKRKSDII